MPIHPAITLPALALALAGTGAAMAQEGAPIAPSQGGVAFEDIAPPEAERSGVFVSQIGSGNQVRATQANGASRIEVTQGSEARPGTGNITEITQGETGTHTARIVQEGEANINAVEQSGDGATSLLLVQDGLANTASILQNQIGQGLSAAEIAQSGERNRLSLAQNGSDNQTRLLQDGNDNAMTVEQSGTGNRLAWQQLGDNLSDIRVQQNGTEQVMEITQTNGGIMSVAPSSGS